MDKKCFKNIKIAFFDVDGTIIDMEKKKITPIMVETLSKLQDKGIKICLATGRPAMIVPKVPGVEFDAFLTFNGSYCYTKEGEILFSNPIPSEDVNRIIENATSIGRPVSVATRDNMGANGADKDLIDYYNITNEKVELAEDFNALIKDDVYQMMLGCTKDQYDSILKDVNGARITAWWDRAADIIPANGGKGIGVEKMLEFYGLTKDEAIAFGDGANDIEMLQTVGTGVAMGNASDKVKSFADDVCGHVADEGIYHYCKEHNLI